MHLNDILENSSVREISLKTMISEENVEYLVEMKFDAIKKVKTLGFISIIEREYGIDLTGMRDEAIVFYLKNREGRNYYVNKPIDSEEKKGKSKLFLFILLIGFITASWYFFTQFDKKHLHELIPFISEETFENFMNEKNITSTEDSISALSIANIEEEAKKLEEKEAKALKAKKEKAKRKAEALLQNEAPIDVVETVKNEATTAKKDINVSLDVANETAVTVASKQIVSILPSTRLWFGIIDIETKQRDHFSIAQPYSLDVSTQSWLVATSSASFGLKQGEKTQDFSDAKEHYFKISKESIDEISKSEYVKQGGWSQW